MEEKNNLDEILKYLSTKDMEQLVSEIESEQFLKEYGFTPSDEFKNHLKELLKKNNSSTTDS